MPYDKVLTFKTLQKYEKKLSYSTFILFKQIKKTTTDYESSNIP